MTDFPYVAPPEDGLRRAMADARGRRYRKAGLSTSTVAAVLAVAAAIAGGQGTQSLVQQPAPEQPAISRLVPERTHPLPGGPRPNGPGAGQVLGSAQHGDTAPTDSRGGVAQPTGQPVTSDRHTGPRKSGPRYWAGSINRADNQAGYIPTDTACAVPSRPGEPPQLCTLAYAPTGSAPPYQLQAQVCSSRTGLTLLHYAGRNEVDLVVVGAGHEVWRWSQWHPDDTSAHTIGVEANSCTTWSFDWTGVDAQGRKLPKGDYTLRATFLADELAQHRTASYAFTIS